MECRPVPRSFILRQHYFVIKISLPDNITDVKIPITKFDRSFLAFVIFCFSPATLDFMYSLPRQPHGEDNERRLIH